MAVLSYEERFPERASQEQADKANREKSYVRSWIVITDDPLDGPQVVTDHIKTEEAIDLFSPYVSGNDSDSGSLLQSFGTANYEDNPTTWVVTATYSNKMDDGDGGDPTNRRPDVRWSFGQYQKVAEKTIPLEDEPECDASGQEVLRDYPEGKPVANSAGQPFDPPAEMDDSRPILVFTRIESSFSPALAIAYQDAINSDTISFGDLSCLPGQAKIANLMSEDYFENGQTYKRVTYEIHFRRELWILEIMDRGRAVIGAVTPAGRIANLKEIWDEGEETPVADPVKLDGCGQLLADGLPPVYLSFRVYKELPFSVLNIVLPD